jgi:hypothetical protein
MVRLRVEVVMLEVEMVLMVEVMLVGEFVTIKGMVLVLVVVMVEVVVMLEVEMEQMAVVVLVLVLAVMAADRSRWCWRRVGLHTLRVSASYPADLCGDQVDGVELPLLGAESQGILPGAEAQRGHLLLLGSAGLVGARVGGDLGPEEPPVSISSSTQVDRTRAERPCYCNIKVILSRVPC